MKKIFWLVAALGAFYVHGRIMFSEQKVMPWLVEHSAKSISDANAACDDLTKDARIALISDSEDENASFEGGREESCEYMKQGAAALRLIRGSTNSHFDEVRIVRSGFPWVSAEVSFHETSSIGVRGMPTLTMESENTVVVVRTMSGLKIKSFKASMTSPRI